MVLVSSVWRGTKKGPAFALARSGDLRPDDWNSMRHVTPHVSIPSAARAVDVAPSVKALGIGVKTCRAQPLHGKFVCYGCCLHVVVPFHENGPALALAPSATFLAQFRYPAPRHSLMNCGSCELEHIRSVTLST